VFVQIRANIAASFQHVAVEQLAHRVQRSLQWAREVEPLLSCIVVAGGVAANSTVRSRLEHVAKVADIPVFFPPAQLCTDNGEHEHTSACMAPSSTGFAKVLQTNPQCCCTLMRGDSHRHRFHTGSLNRILLVIESQN
jgi:tRNA A37 threonylcarbamoyltransferase TsaD